MDLLVEGQDRAKECVFRRFRGGAPWATGRCVTRLLLVFHAGRRFYPFRRELRRCQPNVESLRRPIGFRHRILLTFGVRRRSTSVQFVRQASGLDRCKRSASTNRNCSLFLVVQGGFICRQSAYHVRRYLCVVELSVSIFQGQVGGAAGPQSVRSGRFCFEGDQFEDVGSAQGNHPRYRFVNGIRIPFDGGHYGFDSNDVSEEGGQRGQFLTDLRLLIGRVVRFGRDGRSQDSRSDRRNVCIFGLFFAMVGTRARVLQYPNDRGVCQVSGNDAKGGLDFRFFHRFTFRLQCIRATFARHVYRRCPQSSNVDSGNGVLSFRFKWDGCAACNHRFLTERAARGSYFARRHLCH